MALIPNSSRITGRVQFDSVPHAATYKERTPDQEDRSAGVQKAERSEINLTKDDIMIKLIFKEDPAIISSRSEDSINIARELALEGQQKMHHNRDKMNNPENWRTILERYKEKYNLEEK